MQVPPVLAARATPLATARRQYGFISDSWPVRTNRPSGPSSSVSSRGTCFTSAAMRTCGS